MSMHILMFSGDPSAAEYGTDTRNRLEEYAHECGTFDVIVPVSRGKQEDNSERVYIHPVHGNPFLRLWNTYHLAKKLARTTHFSLITAQAADEIGLVAYIVAKKYKISLQYQVHTDVFGFSYRMASVKWHIRSHLASFLLPKADCIRVVSERIARSLEMRLGITAERVSILPIFTDRNYFEKGADVAPPEYFLKHSCVLLGVGRFIDKEKNFSMLLHQMPDILAIRPDALLVLVGTGPDEERYRQTIQKMGLKNHVILEPWQSDLRPFYRNAHALIIPSRFEGWSRAAVEAAASSLPVIMTDVGLAGEVIKNEENGFVIPVGDKDALVGAIRKLIEMPFLREKFAHASPALLDKAFPRDKAAYLDRLKKSFSRCYQ